MGQVLGSGNKSDVNGPAQYYFRNIKHIAKTDSKILVDILNELSLPWHCFYLFKQLSFSFKAIVVHTLRKNNGLTYQVANEDIMKACSLTHARAHIHTHTHTYFWIT